MPGSNLLYHPFLVSDTLPKSALAMGIYRDGHATHGGSSSPVDPLVQKFGALQVLDDLIRLRAADVVQHSILAYPHSDQDPASFDHYTGQDLDKLINQAIVNLIEDGLSQVCFDSRNNN